LSNATAVQTIATAERGRRCGLVLVVIATVSVSPTSVVRQRAAAYTSGDAVHGRTASGGFLVKSRVGPSSGLVVASTSRRNNHVKSVAARRAEPCQRGLAGPWLASFVMDTSGGRTERNRRPSCPRRR